MHAKNPMYWSGTQNVKIRRRQNKKNRDPKIQKSTIPVQKEQKPGVLKSKGFDDGSKITSGHHDSRLPTVSSVDVVRLTTHHNTAQYSTAAAVK
jgi:hypothetical protein